ncbi:MAG: SMC domain protein [Nitrospirae bacterium]|nr:MAG: SMC domain protein [Nitrospirota bacterium]
MKLRKLRISNFRGLSDVEFDFDQPTNVIVGPNAIGKTTILEAVRLVKALLMPRYYQETQQVLVSLGAISPHSQLVSNIDYLSLARDPLASLSISIRFELSREENDTLTRFSSDKIALELLRGQMGRSDDQGQFALTQYLSSEEGKTRIEKNIEEINVRLKEFKEPHQIPIELTVDVKRGTISGKDPFYQALIIILERSCPPNKSLISYFPADRAFPTGEVNIQIGSAEASNQIQSHIGQAATKYHRLKQTIVNNLLISGVDENTLKEDFKLVFEKLLPGKQLAGLSITQVGTLKVAIKENATGKIFDIDSMSSGEKGLILTFLLLRRGLAKGGIALIDEPELHLNPAVCKHIIPFLNDNIVKENDLQAIICTHSAEILGTAFDRPDCSVHHLRSHRDSTKIYERDHREVFDALRRLGTTAADSLFSRGNIFVEGEHDTAILEEGFYEIIMGYKITSLGSRGDIEKEIDTLQAAEKRGEIDKLHAFIFDLDNRPSGLTSTKSIRVLQWDRYCLENYLLGKKTFYDTLDELKVSGLGSRGEFEKKLAEIAILQLNEFVAKETYSKQEPDNPGIRSREIARKSYKEIAEILITRLSAIKESLIVLNNSSWIANFTKACSKRHEELEEQWREDWVKLCSGKRLIDDLYQIYPINIPKFDLKKRIVKRMMIDQTEEWILVKSKLLDALQ